MKEQNRFLRGALCGALVMFLVMGALAFAAYGMGRQRARNTEVVDAEVQQKIERIDALIRESYLHDDDMDEEKLKEGLIAGYVNALDDPYSVYYDERETADLQESTQGEYSGIGAVLSQNIETNIITITNVYPDSPAEEAGIRNEDILYKVDGEDITSMDLTEVVTGIKGKEGTEVEITVMRGTPAEEVTVTATRRKIEAETVSYEMKADNIGYIKVTEFDNITLPQYEEALRVLEEQGMKGLVVDLRSNPGGNLSTVCEMLDLMLPEGTIVYTEDKAGQKQTATSDDEHQFKLPMTVLVNGYSASASEIYAGAIQDYELGEIVGTTTYGKGVVQQIFDLGDGTCVKLTISEYFTPNGRNIDGTGIVPDVEVEYEADENDEDADNQLDKALEIIKNKVE